MCSSRPQRQHGCDQSVIFGKCVTNRRLLQTVGYCCPSLRPAGGGDVPPERFSEIIKLYLKCLRLHLSPFIERYKWNKWRLGFEAHVSDRATQAGLDSQSFLPGKQTPNASWLLNADPDTTPFIRQPTRRGRARGLRPLQSLPFLICKQRSPTDHCDFCLHPRLFWAEVSLHSMWLHPNLAFHSKPESNHPYAFWK